ncbi:serine hydrolase domain-containing protein [Saccharibacillus sp. CPCC 101409]|uniref:serine hydrolase domain-containing protein n=1 Tax=Saccharibacillus sp. CPCC 101409 TaxID=3058041 RepID=UPI0026722CEF|nr:serine hydrolase domain-containing protein [Saccharibacillus sp. CPCC 101409]MDO3408916.1 serine hydrolase domain-containing protein [Saccharibacillus sp. CPCC 101409]
MARFDDLSALLESFTEQGPAGCACMIARDGEIVYEGYFGRANREKGIAVGPDTVFRLYSMTKVIVCTAAMILFERGKFLLNEPLHRYLPEFKETKKLMIEPSGYVHVVPTENPVLIRHAFGMTTGHPYPFGESLSAREIRRLRGELDDKTGGRYSLRDEIRATAQAPVLFEPGTRWLYGYGHDLVAGLVEEISGKSIGQFLHDEIFGPLGMKDTGYRYKGDIEQRMAVMYERAEDGTLSPAPEVMDRFHKADALLESGGQGLYGTTSDYLKFASMLAAGGTLDGTRILGRSTIDLMRTDHLGAEQLSDFTNSYSAGYGYGLGVRTLIDRAAGGSNSPLGEFGWTGMAGTWTSISPETNTAIVYMHQMLPNMEEHYHLRVRAAAYGALD